MTAGQPASEFRYWAFISYSHKDASWGRWLHKALETYRVPRRLVGMPIAAGKVPARLSPIFRDRDELPTTSDLGAAVEEALSQSWCLIVICSPESAQSRWVNEEVLAFQRLGRGNNIHCLIVDGGPDPAAPLCFPAALEQAQSASGNGNGKSEPVAADARRFGDGRSHALLKLIAGILGIRYDTLVQREQQRKHRNLFWITCASLALVVVLAASTLIAVTSRQDAVDQRSHAEGLVEFMIGDLRKKLEPDGKLATLDAVGKEALAYYAAQKSEDLDADGLARRARALHMIGEVYDLRGELDEALKVFEQAADSTAELVQREPDNGQRIFDHAQSVFWVGYIAYQRGNAAVAEPAFQKYKRLAESLVKINPKNDDWQAELGYANSNLGTLLFEQRRLEEAAAIFTRELQMSEQLSRRAPYDFTKKARTAQANAWLADVLSMQGKLEQSAGQRRSEIAIYEHEIGANPKNHEAVVSLSIATRTLSSLLLSLGDSPAAVAGARKATDISRGLVGIDPDNVRWIESLVAANAILARALGYTNQHAEAMAHADAALVSATQLVKKDSSVYVWQIRWVDSALTKSRLLSDEGRYQEALVLANAAVERLEKLPESTLKTAERTRPLIWALSQEAEQYEKLGQGERARSTRQRIVSLAEENPNETQDPGASANLAIVLLALERSDLADPIVSSLGHIGYLEPSYIAGLKQYGPRSDVKAN